MRDGLLNHRFASIGRRLAMAIAILVVTATSTGCALFTTLPGLTKSKALGPDGRPAQFDLGEHPTWIDFDSNEKIVGAEAAMTADPVLIESRRRLRSNDDILYADSREEAERIVVIRLAVPGEDETLGQSDVGMAAATVKVFDVVGEEVWPDDGSEGKVVNAKVSIGEPGDRTKLRRDAYRLLGKKIGALFTGTYDE